MAAPRGLQDLSSPPRDRTWAPGSESSESQPLEIPSQDIFEDTQERFLSLRVWKHSLHFEIHFSKALFILLNTIR